jgi:hypothetical protein
MAGRRMYLGGHFSRVRGKPRHAMAAVERKGRLLPFGFCQINGAVRTIDTSPNGRHVYVGGGFTRVCGHADRNLVRMTPTGRALHFKSHPHFPVWDLVATAHRVDVAGAGPGGHIGSFTPLGVRRWVVQTDGNVQAIAVLGKVVYAGGNFDHICVGLTPGGNGGFDCADNLATRHKLVALGSAAGGLKAWNPSPNSPLGVSALTPAGGALSAGGSFTMVGGEQCEGYARFSMG